MKMTNVLLVYKKSMYQIYFVDREGQLSADLRFRADDLLRLKAAHDDHIRVLNTVRAALSERRIRYHEVYRARLSNYAPFDFVIAVGGDGTFIEASHRISHQPILGVNSDPKRSIGFFCSANADDIGIHLDRIRDGNSRIRRLTRMALTLDGQELDFQVMNEILVAHQSPAAMSCYRLHIGDDEENQRGSGVWLSTAAGSTGAIRSAGGKVMRLGSRRLQYLPRELFRGGSIPKPRLTGGILHPTQSWAITSRMREGIVYVDGAHTRLPFPYGRQLKVAPSACPLKVVQRLTG